MQMEKIPTALLTHPNSIKTDCTEKNLDSHFIFIVQ